MHVCFKSKETTEKKLLFEIEITAAKNELKKFLQWTQESQGQIQNYNDLRNYTVVSKLDKRLLLEIGSIQEILDSFLHSLLQPW